MAQAPAARTGAAGGEGGGVGGGGVGPATAVCCLFQLTARHLFKQREAFVAHRLAISRTARGDGLVVAVPVGFDAAPRHLLEDLERARVLPPRVAAGERGAEAVSIGREPFGLQETVEESESRLPLASSAQRDHERGVGEGARGVALWWFSTACL